MLFMKVKDGDFKICAELGKAYYYGNGATKDINKAIQLYEKACDGEEMFGCYNLAFAGFLTDLKLNERIRRSWLADHGSVR